MKKAGGVSIGLFRMMSLAGLLLPWNSLLAKVWRKFS